jgi:hypothetical protein
MFSAFGGWLEERESPSAKKKAFTIFIILCDHNERAVRPAQLLRHRRLTAQALAQRAGPPNFTGTRGRLLEEESRVPKNGGPPERANQRLAPGFLRPDRLPCFCCGAR